MTADETVPEDAYSATNNTTFASSSIKKQRRSTMGAPASSAHKGIGKLESFKLKERQKEYERRSKELT